jgi:ribonucleotide reductase alpha subunit
MTIHHNKKQYFHQEIFSSALFSFLYVNIKKIRKREKKKDQTQSLTYAHKEKRTNVLKKNFSFLMS